MTRLFGTLSNATDEIGCFGAPIVSDPESAREWVGGVQDVVMERSDPSSTLDARYHSLVIAHLGQALDLANELSADDRLVVKGLFLC